VRLKGLGKLKKKSFTLSGLEIKQIVIYSTEFYQNSSRGLGNETCKTMLRLIGTISSSVDVIAMIKQYNTVNTLKPLLRHLFIKYKTKTKLHGLSPRANYTDRATAACRRCDCQLLRIEGATWLA
jgi:hypothetical protein